MPDFLSRVLVCSCSVAVLRVNSKIHIQPDPQQQQAIEHVHGPMLVVAGAGTGKTTVLTRRIAHLVRQGHARPDEILVLTYTVNAAEEMLTRLETQLGKSEAKGFQVHTFHDYCFKLLIRAGRDFKVLDDKQLWIFLRRSIRELRLNYFVRAANVSKFLDDLLDFIRRCHDELIGPEQYADYVRRVGCGEFRAPRVSKSKDAELGEEEALGRCREIAFVFETAERMLRERNLGTFGHQILRAYQLLTEDSALRDRERSRLRFILVDEFQDANFAQIRILQKLTGEGASPCNVFAVGDPDQAIYRFRGASSEAFVLFQNAFPNSKLVVLSKNRRSTTPILNCAHAVIAHNPGFALQGDGSEYRRTPLSSARDEQERDKSGKRAPVEVVIFSAPYMEAGDLVSSLIEVRRRSRCNWKDLAVLYRSHTHREEVAAELAGKGIPFSIEALDVMDAPEVRDLLACLGAVVSPADSASLLRAAALRQFSVDPSELRAAIKGLPRDSKQGLATVLPRVKGGTELLTIVEQTRQEITGKKTHAALFSVIRLFELPRRPAIQAVLEFVRRWEESPLTATQEPGEFLEYLDLFREARGTIALPVREDEDSVKLMTVHGAKGLEFDHVFLLKVVSNCFPATYREPLIEFPPTLRNSSALNTLDDKTLYEQEERRLFYVAMTRARDSLTVYGPFGRGMKEKTPPGYLRELLKNHEIKPWLKQRACRELQSEIFAAAEPMLLDSRLAEWIALPLGSNLAATLSASAIERYKVCPLQFKLEREWRIPAEVSAAVQYGASMHRVLRAFYDSVRMNRIYSESALLELFRSDLASEAIADRYQHDLYEQQGIAQLKEFLTVANETRPDVLHTEEQFSVRLGNSNLVGRIDRIDRAASEGAVIITDYKTGRPKAQGDADDSLQLSLYALAAREKWGYKAERLVFHNLEGNSTISTSRSNIQLEEARREVVEIAAKIAAGHFEAKPGFQCNSCAYRLLCPKTEKRVPELLAIRAAKPN
jgi:DNA helicase II / ATP-dependent DNA helicase PcrA